MTYKISALNSKELNAQSSGFNLFGALHKFLAIIVILWMSNGLFTYLLPFVPNIFRYALFLLWFAGAVLNNKSFLTRFLVQTWPLLYFLLYLSIFVVFSNLDFIDNYISFSIYLLMIYSIFLYYFKDKYSQFRKVIVGVLFIEIIFVAINTYIALERDPLIARALAAGLERASSFSGDISLHALGGYSYFYALVPVILLLIYLLFTRSKRKILTLIFIALLFLTLIKAAYTIAILMLFVFIILILGARFFYRFPFKKYPFIPFFMAIIIILVLTQNVITPVLRFLSSISWMPDVVVVRLYELINFLMGGLSANTDLYSRFTLYSRSIDTFLNNFFMGIAVPPNDVINIGGHSSIFDTLAYFGIFALPLFYFFFKAYKYIKKQIPQRMLRFYNLYWLYFLIIASVNTLFFASIFTVCFIFLPFALISLFKDNNKFKKAEV